MKKEISVLIPDGENPILILVINCLSQRKDIKSYVMSNKKTGHMRYSRFVEKYIYYPETTDLDWIKNIDYEVEKNDIDVVLPIYETAIGKLSVLKDKLEHKNKLCFLPDIVNFKTARNKGLLYQHLKANNFSCPKTVFVKHGTEPQLDGWNFPVIVKPVEGSGGGTGIEVLSNYQEVLGYFSRKEGQTDTIVQDFIEGYDICSNVLFRDGEILAYSCQKGNIFHSGEQTAQIGFDFVENEELFNLTKKLLTSLNWSGVANIDWRYDRKEKDFKAIEINTRFWGNIDASAFAGVNFPYLYCLSSMNISFLQQQVKLMTYLSLRGLVHQIKRKPYIIFNIGFLLNNTGLIFFLKDPIPSVYKLIWQTKNSFLNFFKKKIDDVFLNPKNKKSLPYL